ncbi:MAG: PGPGW domain-containing protein [Gammaproteobacteria bacterium]|nr:PGPGW domain-containing protein [Gammaproteobacteria bacterium]MBA3731504.1 PGPGW domain-containing protein [Gammaproteobacteria bacterium]
MYKPQDTDHPRAAVAQPALKPQAAAHQAQAAPGDGLFVTGLRQVRRIAVLLVGGVVLLAGIIMLVTPGPGLLGIAVGLGILSIEFAWARSLLHTFKQKYMDARESFSGRKTNKPKSEKEHPPGR